MFRKSLFWLHLAMGVVAGLIILIMSVTGVLLTYEKQIVAWAERRDAPAVQGGASQSVEALLTATPGASNVSVRRGEAPVIAAGREAGAQQSEVRAFFRTVEDWHRWLGALPEGRQNARAITGASNLAFLFIVVSGLVLWFPRKWRWQNVRAVLWFRGGLSAKARDFNWHNTAGFWCCVPLFFIVLSGVVMSYPWANDMVYTMNGVKPPQGKGKDKGRAKGGDFNRSRTVSTAGLDSLLAQVEQQNPEWRTITFTAPGSDDAPVTFNVDTGTGGQPQLKSTVTLARETGQLLKSEAFTDQDAGRQARSWMRFMHTGEYYGLTGQTIAGIASLGGALLVWTGFALAYRRFRAWVGRRSAHQQLADKAAA